MPPDSISLDDPETPAVISQDLEAAAEVPKNGESLRRRALHASAWVISTKFVGMALQLLRSIILTRLLFPKAFGLMALVSVVMQGLQMCSDVGIIPSIIKSPRGNEERFLQTAWTVQIVRGFALWLMCCLLAWPASLFYHEQSLLWLLPVGGFSIVISSFNTTAWAVHDRDMNRARLTMIAIGAEVLNLVTMTLAAWWLRSVWALVIGGLAGTSFTLILGNTLLPGERHRLRWEKEAVAELVHFGKWIFASTLLTFFAMQLDKLMLGKLVPFALLGVYSISLTLASLPKDLAQQVASLVLFPVLAERLREKPEQIHHALQRSRGLLLRIGLLLCLAVLAAAPAFFHLLYDSRYAAAGWMAQLLAFSCWITVMNASTGYALLAFGDSKSVALGNLVNAVVTIVAAIAGFTWFGIGGFIIGYALGTAAGELVQAIQIRQHGVGVLRQDAFFSGLAIFSAVTYAGLFWCLHINQSAYEPYLASTIGALLWLCMAAWILPSVIRDLMPNAKRPGMRVFGRLTKREAV
ncbi:MAG: oligosaccharide flippase family protein [Phycisphaerae bacterium]